MQVLRRRNLRLRFRSYLRNLRGGGNENALKFWIEAETFRTMRFKFGEPGNEQEDLYRPSMVKWASKIASMYLDDGSELAVNCKHLKSSLAMQDLKCA